MAAGSGPGDSVGAGIAVTREYFVYMDENGRVCFLEFEMRNGESCRIYNYLGFLLLRTTG